MKIDFHKYEGAGNDFIIIDNRARILSLTKDEINLICDRRFGIGGDGLMLLEPSEDASLSFKMVYYNSDGSESTFCGNGGRCIAHFAHYVLQLTGTEMDFMASDGVHHADILDDNRVALSMQPVKEIQFFETHTILDTGSPHYVKIVQHLTNYPVVEEGRKIRNQQEFQPKGINVNFLEQKYGQYFIRTYERGVEDETYACGTGITAAAIASAGHQVGTFAIALKAKKGHDFLVSFEKINATSAKNIILEGPVHNAFQGVMTL